MGRGKRRRAISSCMPCYTRKQKCDRKYPCDHCTRRRRPELCAYYPTRPKIDTSPSNAIAAVSAQPSTPTFQSEGLNPHGDVQVDVQWGSGVQVDSSDLSASVSADKPLSSKLTQAFGYCEQSNGNVVALLQKLGLRDSDSEHDGKRAMPTESIKEVQSTLDGMPSRPILDFLTQYFVNHVNWMDQLLYPPWFLNQYRKWWALGKITSINDVEFAILFLKVCSYSSQFLPSPAYTSDTIKGTTLAEIRTSCERVVEILTPICTRLNPRGCFFRVQHLVLGGLGSLCQGQMEVFWEVLGCAVRAAQRPGIRSEHVLVDSSPRRNELEGEMRRRIFCNLHLWDSLLSRRLDRTPFLPNGLSPHMLPQMQLHGDLNISKDAPDVFQERLLRAQLADFWRTNLPEKESEYDPITTEERYEEFCSTFLPKLPPTFALRPDRRWDDLIPALRMQREMLHMDIFEALCYNFGPVLFPVLSQVERLPAYKRILLMSHKRSLAIAAMRLLDGASNLHKLIAGSHTRFVGIIVPCFEAAVPLLCLYVDASFSGDVEDLCHSSVPKTDPLRIGATKVTRDDCIRAVRNALGRLEILAEVNNMADVAAQILAKLIRKAEGSVSQLCFENNSSDDEVVSENTSGVVSEDWDRENMQNYPDRDDLASYLSNTFGGVAQKDWAELLQEQIANSELGDVPFLEIETW